VPEPTIEPTAQSQQRRQQTGCDGDEKHAGEDPLAGAGDKVSRGANFSGRGGLERV
jgi:hypothetical protein